MMQRLQLKNWRKSQDYVTETAFGATSYITGVSKSIAKSMSEYAGTGTNPGFASGVSNILLGTYSYWSSSWESCAANPGPGNTEDGVDYSNHQCETGHKVADGK